jgi:hypothetical protein
MNPSNLGRLAHFMLTLFGAPRERRLIERLPEPVNAAGQPLKRGNYRANTGEVGTKFRRDPNKRHRRV